MRRLRYLTAFTLLLLAVGYGAELYAHHQVMRKLIIDDSVHADFESVIQETWAQFVDVFAARTDCFGDVRVKADYDLSDRALYDPETATISVRVPARAAILQAALVHEWAHHVEFQCGAQVEMRAAFIQAQGLAANTPWRLERGTANILSSDWAAIPSEQYAEAAVDLVLGNRLVPTHAHVTPAGIQVVKAWAQKETLPEAKEVQ